MSRTESTMLELGVKAPNFSLLNTHPGVGGETVTLGDYAGSKALLVMFICNHCPYVIHLRQALIDFATEFEDRGLSMVAISSNSVESHPQDGPEAMAELAAEFDFPFPYLYDQSQQVAKSYKAACTPDFFLFDGQQKLVYRGQFDSSRPRKEIEVSGEDMYDAVEALLAGEPITDDQTPSMGCNIKWIEGKEPDYFGS